MPGAVQARKRAALSARMTASVTVLPYQEGQWVAAGTVVVRLDDAAVRAAVAAAEAGLRAAESDLERTKVLVENGIAATRELEHVSAAAKRGPGPAHRGAGTPLHTALRAPFAGRIAARHVNLGDVVSPGTPLIEIEGEGGLELRATVESELAARLRPGSNSRRWWTASRRRSRPTRHRGSPVRATRRLIASSCKADLPAASGPAPGLFARLLVPGVARRARLPCPRRRSSSAAASRASSWCRRQGAAALGGRGRPRGGLRRDPGRCRGGRARRARSGRARGRRRASTSRTT